MVKSSLLWGNKFVCRHHPPQAIDLHHLKHGELVIIWLLIHIQHCNACKGTYVDQGTMLRPFVLGLSLSFQFRSDPKLGILFSFHKVLESFGLFWSVLDKIYQMRRNLKFYGGEVYCFWILIFHLPLLLLSQICNSLPHYGFISKNVEKKIMREKGGNGEV